MRFAKILWQTQAVVASRTLPIVGESPQSTPPPPPPPTTTQNHHTQTNQPTPQHPTQPPTPQPPPPQTTPTQKPPTKTPPTTPPNTHPHNNPTSPFGIGVLKIALFFKSCSRLEAPPPPKNQHPPTPTRNKNYQTIYAMTKMEKSERSWHGETGHIDKAMLARFVPDAAAPIYYISGPPAMVTVMKETLTGAEANEGDIRSEDFAGY